MSEQEIRAAAENARYVYSDACNHTKEAIDYMEQVLLASLAATTPKTSFDDAWAGLDWDKWRGESIKDLVRHLFDLTAPVVAHEVAR